MGRPEGIRERRRPEKIGCIFCGCMDSVEVKTGSGILKKIPGKWVQE